MSDNYTGIFGTYSTATLSTAAAVTATVPTAGARIVANIESLEALLNGEPPHAPDFDEIPEHCREQLLAEIDALKAKLPSQWTA